MVHWSFKLVLGLNTVKVRKKLYGRVTSVTKSAQARIQLVKKEVKENNQRFERAVSLIEKQDQ